VVILAFGKTYVSRITTIGANVNPAVTALARSAVTCRITVFLFELTEPTSFRSCNPLLAASFACAMHLDQRCHRWTAMLQTLLHRETISLIHDTCLVFVATDLPVPETQPRPSNRLGSRPEHNILQSGKELWTITAKPPHQGNPLSVLGRGQHQGNKMVELSLQSPNAQPLHLSTVPQAPEDLMFGLSAAYRSDTFPRKVDLGVGAYRGENERP
jgi:hypothetical protein